MNKKHCNSCQPTAPRPSIKIDFSHTPLFINTFFPFYTLKSQKIPKHFPVTPPLDTRFFFSVLPSQNRKKKSGGSAPGPTVFPLPLG